jgi:DNA-binding transcriptional LysR family regulator
MDWDKLRIFHAVAEAGSFTHAGHELALSQSAVSRQISASEPISMCRCSIAMPRPHPHRTGRSAFTARLRVFTNSAAKTRLMDSKEKPSELRITTTVGLGPVWLTPRIKEFIELYPQISVHALAGRPRTRSPMREADVAIRAPPHPPGSHPAQAVHVHHHVYASTDYIKNTAS